MIVPEWHSASWRLLLVENSGIWKSFISQFIQIQPYKGIFLSGSVASDIFTTGVPSFSILALKLCFVLIENSSWWNYYDEAWFGLRFSAVVILSQPTLLLWELGVGNNRVETQWFLQIDRVAHTWPIVVLKTAGFMTMLYIDSHYV